MIRRSHRRPRGWAGRSDQPGLDVLGMASDPGGPEGARDPLAPARTVRRALADAGRKAVDVSHLVVAESVADGDVVAFARTALGPHGSTVEAIVVPDPTVLDQAASISPGRGLVLAVMAAGEGTLALCLDRSDAGALDGECRRRAPDGR